MWIQSLGPEYPLEEGVATHSRIVAWRIPWTEEPSGLWSIFISHVLLPSHLSSSPELSGALHP